MNTILDDINLDLDDINLDDIKSASVGDIKSASIDNNIEQLDDDNIEQLDDNNVDQLDDDNADQLDVKSASIDKIDEIDEKEYNKQSKLDMRLDYTWFPLDEKWVQKLMSDKFVEKDCIGDGNCQFSSIQTALTNAGYKIDNNKLRRVIGKYVYKMANGDFYNILQNYRIEKQNGEFKGKWNPFYVKTKRQFINNIINSGFNFEGDSITLGLLSNAIGIDFVIFDNNYNIIDTSNRDNLNDKVVFLYYIKNGNSGHYKTIGLKKNNDKIQTIFKRSNLPKEIDIILDRHTFLLEHIKELYGGYSNKKDVKLNNILNDIEKRLDFKLSNSDKKKVMLILKNLLQNLDFFKKIKINSKG